MSPVGMNNFKRKKKDAPTGQGVEQEENTVTASEM